MWFARGKRCLHGGFAFIFKRFYFCGRREKVLWHVSPSAKSRLELFEYEKNLPVVIARLVPGFDIYRTYLSAILSGGKIRSSTVVRVIETKAGRFGRERDPLLTTCRNERRAFFRRSIHICRNDLAMPVQLLGDISFVMDVYDCL